MSYSGVEFGLLLHTRHLIRKGKASSHVAELWQTAAQAEELGFSHVWVGDSPRLSLLDRAHADCLTVMAALAAKTSRIRILIEDARACPAISTVAVYNSGFEK